MPTTYCNSLLWICLTVSIFKRSLVLFLMYGFSIIILCYWVKFYKIIFRLKILFMHPIVVLFMFPVLVFQFHLHLLSGWKMDLVKWIDGWGVYVDKGWRIQVWMFLGSESETQFLLQALQRVEIVTDGRDWQDLLFANPLVLLIVCLYMQIPGRLTTVRNDYSS